MRVTSALSLCAAAGGAAAVQIPLLSGNQAPIDGASDTKPLVNSSALQDLISGDRLMTRAKKLYEIAKLGEPEYNHPTRVIGSAGMSVHVCGLCALLIIKRPSRYPIVHLRDHP